MALGLHLRGRTPYASAHALQVRLVAARANGEIPDLILYLEHEETITVGRRRGADSSVLFAGEVPVIEVERGGDATWHGPGQLVAYPILHLEGARADLHRHLRGLEQGVIDLLAEAGLAPSRDARNTGVWLPNPPSLPQKVCSIGIAARRWVTWHGLALNIDPDPAGFARIKPCGFEADIMTRLSAHLDPCPPLEAWITPLHRALCAALEVERGALTALAVDQVPGALGLTDAQPS